MPNPNFTEAQLQALTEQLHGESWKIVEAVFDAKKKQFDADFHASDDIKRFKYCQGKLDGILELWREIYRLAQPKPEAPDEDTSEPGESAWVRQLADEIEEPSEAAWVKRR